MPAESPFCKSVPNLYRAWDNTLLRALKACGYLHLLTHIHQYRLKKHHPRLTFGILYHKGKEAYEHLILQNISHQEALERMVDFTIKKAYEVEYSPEDDNTRTLECLLRALVWHAEHYRQDTAQTIVLANGKPAVELSFTVELPIETPDGEPYLYCGHIDKLVRFGDQILVVDYKTTSSQLNDRYFSQFNPDGQMSGYTYGGKIAYNQPVNGALIDACQLAVNFCRFDRKLTPRTNGQIDEWLENTCHWIKAAERYCLENSWPMNETSCHNYGGCDFRKSVCSKDPAVRMKFLEGGDFIKQAWNPLEAREL